MKYCQKCRAMLKDEVEICPVCGCEQKPEEEFTAAQQKKKKTVKAVIFVSVAVLAAVLLFLSACMILGKEPETVVTDETYTEEVTDTELMEAFAEYVGSAMPTLWQESEEALESEIEYFNSNDLPKVAAGLERLRELKPAAGAIENVVLKGVAQSEEGSYKLLAELVCENGKINCLMLIDPSGAVNDISLELKEETLFRKVREFLVKTLC